MGCPCARAFASSAAASDLSCSIDDMTTSVACGLSQTGFRSPARKPRWLTSEEVLSLFAMPSETEEPGGERRPDGILAREKIMSQSRVSHVPKIVDAATSLHSGRLVQLCFALLKPDTGVVPLNRIAIAAEIGGR